MGVMIKEILNNDSFKDFQVIAGHGGLNNQIQGIAILDAPDGFEWTTSRELVLSTGYVFYQNPGLLEKYLETDHFKNTAAIGIKLNRYLQELPQHILTAFDKHKIPLINVPADIPWMVLVNQLNILVINKYIKQFKIDNINPHSFSNLPYQERKIKTILSEIEYEMNFPTMLYDLNNNRPYYSSPKFQELMEDLELEDFWNPSFEYSKHPLCDNLQMSRYRFKKPDEEIPYSWITVPITAGNKIQAYFVVIEAMDLIDYFDQFAIRIGFLLLQSLYENILIAQFIGDVGFEKFIIELINNNVRDLNRSAEELGIDTNEDSFLLLVQGKNPSINFLDYKNKMKNCANNSLAKLGARQAVLGPDSCIFLLGIDHDIPEEQFIKQIEDEAENFFHRLEKKINGLELTFGLANVGVNIYDFNRNYERAIQSINMGELLYPERNFVKYTDLGVFAWLDIQKDELDIMLKDIDRLTKSKKYREHVEILKAYLECNMNYTLASKKLFLHINTVRKKIMEVNELINIDLDNPTNRLKLEILLMLLAHF